MSENDEIKEVLDENKDKHAKVETKTTETETMSFEETIKTYEKKLDEEIEDAY